MKIRITISGYRRGAIHFEKLLTMEDGEDKFLADIRKLVVRYEKKSEEQKKE